MAKRVPGILQRKTMSVRMSEVLAYIAKNGPLTRDFIMDKYHLFPVEFMYIEPLLEVVGCSQKKTDLLFQIKEEYLVEVLLRYDWR